MKGESAIVLAHRLATIEDIDRIDVLKSGRLVESGSHGVLVATEGHYAKLDRLLSEWGALVRRRSSQSSHVIVGRCCDIGVGVEGAGTNPVPKPEDRVQWMIKKLLPKQIKNRVMNAWKFSTAKYVVVSYPKSGRTWLRATLTFYFAERYGLDSPPLLEFANLHRLDRRIPKIFFTHDDDSNARPEALERDKSRYRSKHVLLLARDPRDVCVSMYFHRKKRDLDLDVPVFEFANGVEGGLRTAIEFLNIWADALREIPDSHCLSYEAMHAEPEQTLADALRFLGEEPDPRALEIAIKRARFDKLRAMERVGTFESGRLTPADAADSDSFKVRRGKVGGYADYFDADQQWALDGVVADSLSSFFGPLIPPH